VSAKRLLAECHNVVQFMLNLRPDFLAGVVLLKRIACVVAARARGVKADYATLIRAVHVLA